MYQNILTFSLIFLAAITKISFAPSMFLGHITPDILLVMVVIWAARKTFDSFWLWAIMSGFILDLVSLERIGVNVISFLVIAFGVDFLSKRFFINQRRNIFFWIAVLVCGAVVVNYFLLGGIHLLIGKLNTNFFSWRNLFFEIVNNLFVFIIIYRPLVSFKNVFPVAGNKLIVK